MTSVMFVLNVDDDNSGAKMDGPHEEQESERAKPRQKINERRSVKSDQMIMRVPFAYDESIRIVVIDFVTENTTRRPCNNCGGCEGVKKRKHLAVLMAWLQDECTSAGPKMRVVGQTR